MLCPTVTETHAGALINTATARQSQYRPAVAAHLFVYPESEQVAAENNHQHRNRSDRNKDKSEGARVGFSDGFQIISDAHRRECREQNREQVVWNERQHARSQIE